MKYTLLTFLLLTSLAQVEASLVTLDTRPGVTQQIIVEQPSNSKANLVLFSGGKGKLRLNSNKYKTNKNFLVRSRHLFTDNNYTVILVDAPSDKQGRLV